MAKSQTGHYNMRFLGDWSQFEINVRTQDKLSLIPEIYEIRVGENIQRRTDQRHEGATLAKSN